MLTFRSAEIAAALGLAADQSADAAELDLAADDLVIELFDQFQVRLLLYVRSFGLPTQDSEDVLQEAFLSLFQHLVHGRSRANLRGWLFRVCHNLALKRRSSIKLSGLGSPGSYHADHKDSAPTPHDLLEFREAHTVYAAVLEAMPEQDRCCLLLRAEGLKYREIAALVGMSLGSVSSSISRSLARFTRAAER